MSLNYDVSACKRELLFFPAEHDDPEGSYKAGEMVTRTITSDIIWACLSIDIGEITEKNWIEFFSRIDFLQKLDGKRDGSGGSFISWQDVRNHIGLKTNVSYRKWDAWAKRIAESELRMITERTRRAVEKEVEG